MLTPFYYVCDSLMHLYFLWTFVLCWAKQLIVIGSLVHVTKSQLHPEELAQRVLFILRTAKNGIFCFCVCVDDVKGLILFWAEMDLQIQLFELVGEKGVELIPDIIQNRRALLVAQKSAAADEPSVGVFVSMPVGCTLCHLDSPIDSQLAEETYRRPGDHHVGGGPPRGEDEAQGEEEGTQDGPDYLPADATGEGKGQSIVRSRSLHFDNYSFMIVCLIIDFNAGYAGFRREGAA